MTVTVRHRPRASIVKLICVFVNRPHVASLVRASLLVAVAYGDDGQPQRAHEGPSDHRRLPIRRSPTPPPPKKKERSVSTSDRAALPSACHRIHAAVRLWHVRGVKPDYEDAEVWQGAEDVAEGLGGRV